MGRVIIALLLLFFAPSCFSENKPYEQLFQFKQGSLIEDETWSGKILLLSDVQVPKGVKLTIFPGSWVIYNEVDLYNLGNDPSKPEIIVNGELTISDNDEIKLYALGDENVQQYIREQSEIEAMVIQPKPEPLTDLEENLHTSKRAYAWLWVAVYSIWLVL